MDGLWVSRRDPEWTAALADVTWGADDGIRYMHPEVVRYHKALQSRPKDERDRDVAWPLPAPGKQAWMADAVRRFYGDEHPWPRWMAERVAQ